MRQVARCGVVLAIGALFAMPAAAKEGVRAKLDRPVHLDTAPGQTIRVAWRLVDPEGGPFGASGIYLRVSRCGGSPRMIPATARGPGHYTARVTVPDGGIRALRVGLKGWRIIGDRRERADMRFEFAPRLRRPCA